MKKMKGLKILVAIIITMIIGQIIVFTISNNFAMAKIYQQGCSLCGGSSCTMYVYQDGAAGHHFWGYVCEKSSGVTAHSYSTTNTGVGTHTRTCSVCDYSTSGSCSGGSWRHKSGTQVHQKHCGLCGWFYKQENCYDNNGDGSCDASCGNTGMHTHSYSSTETEDNGNGTHSVIGTCSCGATKTLSTSSHSFGSYSDNGDGYHSASCSECSAEDSERHSYNSYADNGNGKHSANCTGCTNTITEDHSGATHDNGGKCTANGCSAVYENHSQSTEVKEYESNENGHTPIYGCSWAGCDKTVKGELENHYGGTHDNEGKCALSSCGYKYQTHGKSTEIKEYDVKADGHTPIYKCTDETCDKTYTGEIENHTGATHDNGGICTVEGCGYKYENHGQSTDITSYDVTADGHTPIYGCTYTDCDKTYTGEIENHYGGTHDNEGRCQLTACGRQYQNHSQSTNIKEYESNENGHTAIYECTEAECTSTYTGRQENHYGATHENGGKCSLEGCEYTYESHSRSTEVKAYDAKAEGHTPIYGCTWSGCDKTYSGELENHRGATHDNEGKCTVEGCGYKYQNHSQSTKIKEYESNENGHTAIYECTHIGCTSTYTGRQENHYGATHENEGKCAVEGCEYKYQNHGKSTDITGYEKSAEGHTPVYGCTDTNCDKTYIGEIENHTGATHDNGGRCQLTACGYQYETHGQSTNIKEYESNENGHTAVYECTHAGCTSTYKGTQENHTGATHENEGRCTVEGCGYKYENHGKSTEVKEYYVTDDGHTPIYVCTDANCDKTYTGEMENHTGGTHDNDGICTVEGCGHKYQTHGQETEIREYEATENGHTPIYGCIHSGCTTTYKGEQENHTGATHENGGICTVEGCGFQYDPHDKKSEIKEYKKSESGHIAIYECINPECTELYEGQEEEHIGGTHNNDGTCAVEGCGYKYQTHGKSTEIKEYRKTESGHTPVYSCTHSECTATYNGTEEPHTVEQWTDNNNGTHSGDCTICDYTVTEEHDYEDDKCKDCNSDKPEDKCQHTYLMKYDKNQHWEECTKCEDVKAGTLEAHKYTKYTDNGDGTHSSTCTVCKYKLTEAHQYDDDKCADCDSEKVCEHSYTTKYNETHHYKICTKCNEIKEGTLEEHTLKYKDNGNGTHTAECTGCAFEKTEKHKTDGTCCEDKNGGSGDNKDDKDDKDEGTTDKDSYGGTKDDTTAKEELPKAGFQSIVIVLVIAIGAVSAISILKMNKYKDI